MTDIPAFNPSLTLAERTAVARVWAKDFAAEVIRESGIDPRRVNMERVEAEGVALLMGHWVDAATRGGKEAA